MHWSFWVIMGIFVGCIAIIKARQRTLMLLAEIDENVRRINPENPYDYLK